MALLIGFSVSSGYVDLSREKATSQTLTWPCPHRECKDQYISKNAVDRDKDTCTRQSVIGGRSEDKTGRWKVDLGAIYSIYSINILFKDIPEHRCNETFYGMNCEKMCSLNCENQRCNIINGTCLRCRPGWTGMLCKSVCPRGWYGHGCKKQCSGHCRNNDICDHVTGRCDNGCADGWIGRNCEESCKDGNYGPGCVNNCSGHCLNDSHCNKQTGHCDTGCKPGYTGDLCNLACTLGYFGNQCRELCSQNCWNDEICKHTDGICTSGCKDGYIGGRCNKWLVRADQVSNAPSSDTLTAIGVVGPLAVVIIIVVLVILVIRYKRKSSETSTKQKNVLNMKHISIVDQVNRESSSEHSNVQDTDIIHNSKDNDVENECAKRGPPTNKCIPVNNLQSIIYKMSASEDTDFQYEYQDIPKGELHPCQEANRPENKAKNRYKTTFPYDHSRVVLKTSSPSEGDYINASYIEDVQGKRSYIATQGPKPKTIADFWKMIWQEDVSIIVCLTNLKEGAKIKCAQYWPNINDKLQSGDFNIRNIEEKVYANYTKRHFKVFKHLEQTDREVVMFHYTRWPDHGVPDPLSLVVFHRHVMRVSSKYPGKYIAVHCSAGIGRTGTYIALDALYREGERNGKVNVPMYVRTMRKDRMNMIQGDEQYKSVYLVLYESFVEKSRCMTTEQILQADQDTLCYANCGEVTSNPLSADFKKLLSLRKTYTDKDYESGNTNMAANYTKDVLPVEEFMCRLTYSKGRSTYYNAVFLQSYKENDSLITAQYPVQDYTEDFLRLVKDMNVRVVVFLCPLSDLESSPLWFPSKNMEKTVGSFTIKLTSCEDSANVSKTSIHLKPKGCSSMRVTVLECPKLKGGLSIADKRDLVDIVKAAKSENFDHGNRLLILSSDGATRCGAFCVVYNALEQLSMDQEVDIFTITRQLQIRRPEFLSNLEEYQLCHEAVAEYLRNDSVYANF
ncbi:receptor-type tyrosine-protein phosphatase epsilon-like [Saccostrea echinata]|uniref:receptor-type tyrosine-protein phosphatase epsilon-like n=1 Tax=Saccostrea echinata TaxID=191078 RepID=UPI002A818CAA|nr:receptor-type tyrosine-protein phosphatase epsilon-like [Saccostrea echinata]